ncbi:MAG: GNAT family N-acetyltransferase [Lachnospiraceae bacterium oral taxon 082]|nr:GNAT family N-acetyltransferase [Lachnospiraceae bacterium oral taxon 082]
MIRHVKADDLDRLATIEAASYPKAEAASKESIKKRMESFPECFWVLEEDGVIKSFINGMATDEEDLTDIMYDDASMHKKDGEWQMIFSVVTEKSYRGQGLAKQVMNKVIEDCKARKRRGIVLTCKDGLRSFYAGFGYKDEGISQSNHGDTIWYKMRLTF